MLLFSALGLRDGSLRRFLVDFPSLKHGVWEVVKQHFMDFPYLL
jgi:hypothetical protein